MMVLNTTMIAGQLSLNRKIATLKMKLITIINLKIL